MEKRQNDIKREEEKEKEGEIGKLEFVFSAYLFDHFHEIAAFKAIHSISPFGNPIRPHYHWLTCAAADVAAVVVVAV